jgi:hypothetical protein
MSSLAGSVLLVADGVGVVADGVGGAVSASEPPPVHATAATAIASQQTTVVNRAARRCLRDIGATSAALLGGLGGGRHGSPGRNLDPFPEPLAH